MRRNAKETLMPNDSKHTPSFADLEKQLAKDTLTTALKALHGEITSEIDKNKTAFSSEIKLTLNQFKSDLEKTVSAEIDKKLEALMKKHFSDIGTNLASLASTSLSPVVQKTEEEMQRLEMQGNRTVQSWKAMMEEFSSIWNTPFFIVFMASVLLGLLTSLGFSYYLIRNDRRELLQAEKTLGWFLQHVKPIEEKNAIQTKQPPKASDIEAQSKKKAPPRKK